ncbi:MAG TPA: hypothetical protein VFV34_11740 [Blastocatellia bacterium]|nr:hypothetical protein [Blastocatellia bacterium]
METRYIGSDTVRDYGEDSRGDIESNVETLKNRVARKLQSAANAIEDRAGRTGQGNGTVPTYAQRTARWLNTSADYLGGNDISQIKSDVRDQIRRNPGTRLLLAGAVGLILGTILARRK